MTGDWVVVEMDWVDKNLSAKKRREDAAFGIGDVVCRIEICESK